MSLLIDIIDETESVAEEMLKEVEKLLQFAAEREGVQDQAEVSVT
nr:rRNA maturation RNase YbeY [Bacillus pacificus]